MTIRPSSSLLTTVVLSLAALAGLSSPAEAIPRGLKLSLDRGLPQEDGLGKLAIVTNWPKRGAGWSAIERLAKARDARIFRFRDDKIRGIEARLRTLGAEFVALAVTPETIDMNFQIEVLEMCRGLDPDPMPDFHFGYLTARDGKELAGFIDRILRCETKSGTDVVAKQAAITAPGTHLAGLDLILHFGHGKPWQIDGGLTGEQIGGLDLPRAPVVFSGACFTAVTSRSYHPSAYQMIYMKPATVAPERLVSLGWVRAGVRGYLAALEGDRGEMAMAEWEELRQRAVPLGAVIGHQYRLAFTSLPETDPGFPRYVPGAAKRMGFYDVMLRGMISRILVGDPTDRPIGEPIDRPTVETSVSHDAAAKSLAVEIRVQRWSQGTFLNYLPKSGKGVFDRRVTARVPVPSEVKLDSDEPVVHVVVDGAGIDLVRHHVRHEVWGGVRYLNLQVESTDRRVGKAGCVVTFTFPTR